MKAFKNKKILVTGGLGFVGSNLAIKLVELGAKVEIIDAMIPRQGANYFNIDSVKKEVKVYEDDIRDPKAVKRLIKGKDYIFHLAGQVSHVDSIRDPLKDLSINVEGTLVILEECRKNNPETKFIFTGTRGQYGPSVRLPVDEEHPMNPMGVYAISNLCAEQMVKAYDKIHKLKTISFRITNTYGPRHQMMHDEYGVLNWFIRKAIDNEAIPVFGDGKTLRDFLYIEDLINALIESALCDKACGEVFNIGSGKPTNFIELANIISQTAKSIEPKFTDFTIERKQIEPGDYYADISKIKKTTGWEPKVSLAEGIKLTIDYYRKNKKHYWK